jgi:hypothetical protein
MQKLIYSMLVILFLFQGIVTAAERSFLCKYTNGPRSGQVQDFTGHNAGPLPVGSSCNDGVSSSGIIISNRRAGRHSSDMAGGSCRRPESEDDCDLCNSDRSYERCLRKVDDSN